ncbi:MAG: glycyl-radical enzyme activating protein [Clostridiaceae bacterium]|nr:glycyl-radical enzyme activating protein [Clostridiaceae bacterium]
MNGIVFNIQRYMIHDGPGIRTSVFLKGCPLSCSWCHNPEGLIGSPQLMHYIDKCVRCGACASACPHAAITVKDGMWRSDQSLCDGCGLCIERCYYGALELKGIRWTAHDLADELGKDLPFFLETGGGVTFSGGEPLLQAAFVAATARILKSRGIHVTIDTCGAVPWSAFEKVNGIADLFLFDLKTLDAATFRDYIGGQEAFEQIVGNIHRLSEADAAIELVVPLIQGVNDRDEDLERLRQLLKTTKVQSIKFLPYHKMGSEKYERLGLNQAKLFSPPEQCRIETFREIASAFVPNHCAD